MKKTELFKITTLQTMLNLKLFKNVKDCRNTNDFRALARAKLPSPIFNYIDGAAECALKNGSGREKMRLRILSLPLDIKLDGSVR